MIHGTAIDIVQALWRDYSAKIKVASQKIDQYNTRLYELGVKSGESFNELMREIQECKNEQFAIVKEIFSIYEDVKQALSDIDQGTPVSPASGLTRSLPGAEYREKVRKYLEEVRTE